VAGTSWRKILKGGFFSLRNRPRALEGLRGIYARFPTSANDPAEDCCRAPWAALGDWCSAMVIFRRQLYPALLQTLARCFSRRRRQSSVSHRQRRPHVMTTTAAPSNAPAPLRLGTTIHVMAEKNGCYTHLCRKNFRAAARLRDTCSAASRRTTTRKSRPDEMAITEKQFPANSIRFVWSLAHELHAGLAAKFMIERLARLPFELAMEVEFRYPRPESIDRIL